MCGHLLWQAVCLFFHCLFLSAWLGGLFHSENRISCPQPEKNKKYNFRCYLIFHIIGSRVIYNEYFDQMVETITTPPPTHPPKQLNDYDP